MYACVYIYIPTMSAFYISVIHILIKQGDIFFKSVIFRFLLSILTSLLKRMMKKLQNRIKKIPCVQVKISS